MDSETSLTSLKLPVIDFSVESQSLKPETPQWDRLRGQVRQALEEFGCFEAVLDKQINHSDTRRALFEAFQELFDLPLQTKRLNVSDKPLRGYAGHYPALPLYESFGIDDPNIHHQIESFANAMWPQGNSSFCKTIQSYSEQVSELDQIIRRMILESLGVEKYLEEHLGSTDYFLRVMKYKGPQTTEAKLGLMAHTDKNLVTILDQYQVDGLEVQTKDGQWISVNPSPGSFIVFVGDSLYAWANGWLHSPYHRVVMSGNKTRYSAAFFSVPKAGYIVKAPEELVDQQHPLLFKPFDYFEFTKFYADAVGRSESVSLKSFCGT